MGNVSKMLFGETRQDANATLLDKYDTTLFDRFRLSKEAIDDGNQMIPLIQNEFYFRQMLAEQKEQTGLMREMVGLLKELSAKP